MANGRSNKIVGQIGEYLACAEISRRCDCITTPFAGNVPVFDILATNDNCRTIPIQVKTANGGDWQFTATQFLEIELDEATEIQSVRGIKDLGVPDLLFVFVWLGDTKASPDSFALCTAAEFQGVLRDRHEQWLDKHGGHRPRNWKSTHCSIRRDDLSHFADRWDLVTSRLRSP